MIENIEQAHAEALAENAAHDAAMSNAMNLTPELLAWLTRPHPARPDVPQTSPAIRMPQTLRTRCAYRRLHIVPPRRHA